MFRATFLPHFFFLENLHARLFSSLMMILSVVEIQLMTKKAHFFIFLWVAYCGEWFYPISFVFCIEVFCLNLYFVHNEIMIIFSKLSNVPSLLVGFSWLVWVFRGGCGSFMTVAPIASKYIWAKHIIEVYALYLCGCFWES